MKAEPELWSCLNAEGLAGHKMAFGGARALTACHAVSSSVAYSTSTGHYCSDPCCLSRHLAGLARCRSMNMSTSPLASYLL